MNKSGKMIKTISRGIEEHSPEILIAIGITGMISTTVLAVKATPKALLLIEEEKRRQNNELLQEAEESGMETCDRIERLKTPDVIKATWKCYVPAVVTGAVSIACIIGSNSVKSKRNAALATAYKLSQAAFTEYKEQVVETIGEKKEQVIRDKVAEKTIAKDPVSNKEVFVTNGGKVLCYDSISGRYFQSDVTSIKKAVNEINATLNDDMYASLNDFYYEIGLKPTSLGDVLGWNINEGLVDISFSTQMAENDEPCLVLDYSISPRYDFSKLM